MSHVAQHGPAPIRAFNFRGKTVIEFSDAVELKTSDGQVLRGLEVAGKSGSFTAVNSGKQVTIKGNRLIIDTVAHRIRYAWTPYTDANLVNEEGLPASTFELRVSKFQRR
jgi:sialate O-acetylesterase